MFELLRIFLPALASLVRKRHDLVVKNLLLRRQLRSPSGPVLGLPSRPETGTLAGGPATPLPCSLVTFRQTPFWRRNPIDIALHRTRSRRPPPPPLTLVQAEGPCTESSLRDPNKPRPTGFGVAVLGSLSDRS